MIYSRSENGQRDSEKERRSQLGSVWAVMALEMLWELHATREQTHTDTMHSKAADGGRPRRPLSALSSSAVIMRGPSVPRAEATSRSMALTSSYRYTERIRHTDESGDGRSRGKL